MIKLDSQPPLGESSGVEHRLQPEPPGYYETKEAATALHEDNLRLLAENKALKRRLKLVPQSEFDAATANTNLLLNESDLIRMIEAAALDNLRTLLVDHEEVVVIAGLPKELSVEVNNVSRMTDWMSVKARRIESEDGTLGYVLKVTGSARR